MGSLGKTMQSHSQPENSTLQKKQKIGTVPTASAMPINVHHGRIQEARQPATSGHPVLMGATELGGERARDLIQRLRKHDTFPQTMLIVGPWGKEEGVWQLTARALLFITQNDTPCGTCSAKKLVVNNHVVDLNESRNRQH